MKKYWHKRVTELDRKILIYIQNNLRTAERDQIMRFITNLGDGGFVWLIIAFTLLVSQKHRRTGLAMACAIAFGSIITNAIIKNSIRRIRPFEIIEELAALIPHPKDWSFPSGHTTSSVACGILLLKRMSKMIGLTGMTLAILISVSRVYLGVHYPSDIVAGAVAGVASATVAGKVVRRAKLEEI